VVIWVTGLSGAGKTTLCVALRDLLKPRLPQLVLLDGDVVREAFGAGLGFKEEDRMVQIGRMQRLARILSDQGQIVLVAALYSHPDLLAWNRENIKDYFEIYLRAPLKLVQDRDSKGLYHGKAKDVVGVDIPWREPAHADLVIEADRAPSPARLAREVAAAIPTISEALV
jgi:adenylylsulfate kinase-like enzyme